MRLRAAAPPGRARLIQGPGPGRYATGDSDRHPAPARGHPAGRRGARSGKLGPIVDRASREGSQTQVGRDAGLSNASSLLGIRGNYASFWSWRYWGEPSEKGGRVVAE